MRYLTLSTLIVFLALAGHCQIAAGYKSEIEITPDPLDVIEATTKKSSWFGGFKKFFGSSGDPTSTEATTTSKSTSTLTSQSTTTARPSSAAGTPSQAAQKPPPLVISHAPLMPLGPRPDTPNSSPFGASGGPQWPTDGVGVSHFTTSTKSPHQPPPNRPQEAGGAPNLPPGFAPYRPQKPQPNSFELSYGGGGAGRPGVDPLDNSRGTTTTQRPKTPNVQPGSIDVRFGTSTTTAKPQPHPPKEEFPALPAPRRPSVKDDYPPLPTVRSPSAPSSPTALPTPTPSPTPSASSAWASPLPTPVHPAAPVHPAQPPTTPRTANGVSFLPHTGGTGGHSGAATTTVRSGFQSSGSSVASDDEIRQLTEQLYTKESNSQISLVQVNLQGRTRSIDSSDEAPNPLLQVDLKAFEAPTIAKMKLLFNNYEHDTLVNEHVTANERKEENEFLDAVMATPVMRHAMQFLQQKGLVTPDPKTHRDLVKELWFTQYSRGQGKIGSSGFEHVYVYEVKNGTIIGFHNWVYISEEEQAGRFDYKGYMKEQDIGTKGKVLKIRFTHQGQNKPVNTLFVGTSPELELALYTVCFQLRPDRTCPVSLGSSNIGIVTYSWRYRGKNLIGSAYPEI
ncbi:poly(U)-specific endoribonuclease homolog [Drosophila madeirensis]|uniref:Poly(U)-specific endoribonuclease homolog n=1 Tax=Drosophila madeirensis TaxID=30013 RepID=A0AAU9FV36_DROMD